MYVVHQYHIHKQSLNHVHNIVLLYRLPINSLAPAKVNICSNLHTSYFCNDRDGDGESRRHLSPADTSNCVTCVTCHTAHTYIPTK